MMTYLSRIMTEEAKTEGEVFEGLDQKQEAVLAYKLFGEFIKQIPRNYKGVGVTFAALEYRNNDFWLKVIQKKEPVFFYFEDIRPWVRLSDLNILEKRLMEKL